VDNSAFIDKSDTLTITTSTSQLIVTSAHYTVIAKALDCEEYLVTNLLKWSWSLWLCQCMLFEKKSGTKSFLTMTPHLYAREIVDDCFQVHISRNRMLHAHQRQRV